MSLASEYRSGPDEEEIWERVLAPDLMPTAYDDSVAEQEEEHIAGVDYQDKQDVFDEANSPSTPFPVEWNQLADFQQEAVRQFITDIIQKNADFGS